MDASGGGETQLAEGHLPESWSKEDLSVAYSHAMAAAIGVSCETPKRDINGCDALFRGRDTETADAAGLSVQLKCTVKGLKVEKLTVLGGVGGIGNGTGLPDLTGRLIAANEQIKAATGVDLASALRPRPPQT